MKIFDEVVMSEDVTVSKNQGLLFKHNVSYKHNGTEYFFDIWAGNKEDALKRVESLKDTIEYHSICKNEVSA